jgi:hypothetical protein
MFSLWIRQRWFELLLFAAVAMAFWFVADIAR